MSTFGFVTQWYPPEPVEIPRSIALALAAEGAEIRILTGVPNYPTGKVADGHKAWEIRTDVLDGLDVRRAPLYPSHDSSAVKRMANHLSWALSSSVFGQRTLKKVDATLVYSSPATAALPAMVAKALWGTPFVLLVQDVWPDSIFASGFLPGRLGRTVHRLVEAFVSATYAMADHVAVISPGMSTLLQERGVPPGKISVVYNWVPEEDAADIVAAQPALRERIDAAPNDTVFIYAGNHGHAQALGPVVEAFCGVAGAHLVMVGDGVVKPELVALAAGRPGLTFLDPVPREEAAGLIAQADVSVVSLADEPLFSVTMPSKVQTGLATAKPMLVVACGDAATTVVEVGAGTSARPGDVEGIREAAGTLAAQGAQGLQAMGERGRALYRAEMARHVGARRLNELLHRAAESRRTRPGSQAATSSSGRNKQ